MTKTDPTVGEVSDFYDDFLDRRMIGYRLRPNKRLDMASDALLDIVKDGDSVADIGCGIGIVSETVGKACPESTVIGVDLSKANIAYAKQTIDRPNIRFFASDITDQMDVLKKECPQGYDVVFLIDVIEHVPENERAGLLADLAEIAREGAALFLAYPSPEYQDYLRAHEPEELQVIDNNVMPESLVAEAHAAGWSLRSFTYKDVWREGQYIHASFVKGAPSASLVEKPYSLRERVRRGLWALARPYRYSRYVRRPKSGKS